MNNINYQLIIKILFDKLLKLIIFILFLII